MAANHKVDIFETLEAVDKRNFDYYSKLSDDEKKGFLPTVVLRWAAGTSNGDNGETLLYLINEYANFDWFNISDHPELQYKLLCSAALGFKLRHNWIPLPKQSKGSGKLHEFLLKFYPEANTMELNILKNSFTKDTFREFLHDCGCDKKDEKKYLDIFVKETD